MTDNAYAFDGWKEFATEAEANDYAAVTWAQIIHTAPASRIPAEFLALKEAFDAKVAAAAGDVRSVPGSEITAVQVVPLNGLDYLGNPVDRGYSRKWAEPRTTAAGAFAIPCLTGFDVGGPEPEWPQPPPPPEPEA